MDNQSVRPLSPLDQSSPGTTSQGPYDGLTIVQLEDKAYRNVTAIMMLTDNDLLDIFDLCRRSDGYYLWKWHALVQVCRRWRQIIFASPRRLDLCILCTYGSPVRENLGIWPAIPIVMRYTSNWENIMDDEDNMIAALEHPDRVCRINLEMTGSQLGMMAAVMQQPFPVLADLSITLSDDAPVIPSEFLGGSAPCLQAIKLCGIAFPTLPTLLLSTRDLVKLQLEKIPLAGYISPEAMVAHLAALPRLTTLQIEFESVTPGPDPPETRTVLPALCRLDFSGVCGYLEDFLARIDAPQLNYISIEYAAEPVLGVPQLSEFINRSEYLKDALSNDCQMFLHDYEAVASFRIDGATSKTGIYVRILCEGADQQIFHLADMLSCISPILSDMIHLSISMYEHYPEHWAELEDLDDMEWLELLRPFSSVRTLFMTRKIAGYVSRALNDNEGLMVTELLPALELLCLEGQPLSSVDQFIAHRRDSGRPVTVAIRVVNTKRGYNKRLKSYP